MRLLKSGNGFKIFIKVCALSQVSNFGSISTLNRQKVTILEIVRAKLLPRLEKSKHENKQKPLGLFGLETCLNLNHFDQNEARECCNRHSAFPCSLCLAIVPALLALAPLFSIGIYTGFSVGFSKSSTYSSFSFYTVPSYPTSFLKNATTNCYDKSGKWSTTGPNQPRLICYAKPLIAMTSTRSPSEIADQTVPETCTPVIPAITDTKTNYLGSQPGHENYLEHPSSLRDSKTLHFSNHSKSDAYKDARHRKSLRDKSIQESGNIHPNPGPMLNADKSSKSNIKVVSYNVRGLNDEFKLRHLINKFYQSAGGKNSDFIAFLQETYVDDHGKLPYLWRGNFHMTQGLGNRLGCITLLSSHLNIVYARNFENRGHILVCQKSNEQQPAFILVNLYAPNPNNNEKIEFFESIFNEVLEVQARYDCSRLIIAGDYNLTFNRNESKNRNYLAQEINVARAVKNLLQELNLTSIWAKITKFTWRRPNSDCFSTIDHIFYSEESLNLMTADTDWSLTMSDHAAVVANFNSKREPKLPRSRIPRLDPTILAGDGAAAIKDEIYAMINEAPGTWDPHLRLEYAKMCIRTIVERAQAERKIREASEEDLLNTELDLAVKSLETSTLGLRQTKEVIDHIEDLRTQKSIHVENKGKRLAERLGTKWYNEGEKSTKYFLSLLRRSSPDNFTKITNEAGVTLTDESEIETEIINFYKRLYENYDDSNLRIGDNSFFDEITGLSDDEARGAAEPLTVGELGKVLDSCADSAPGPDGIPYSIIRSLWQSMGQIILDAWNYSLATGKLAPSHKISFLKLIPKVGKDTDKLTNWRPITLSNCDHKIITKSYANRLSDRLCSQIEERQTAYLKGRLINDNIRSLISTIKVANLENNFNGLIVSLDAKKAFDSVDHKYIELALQKFGLTNFVPIFRLLYSELSSDVIINGRIVKGFRINRGVKQGDALSCILFIICMEPLLRNIDKNIRINPLQSELLGSELPKSYAYADDVNAVIANNHESLQQLFSEYERLTRLSGLELNANKTELLPIISSNLMIDKSRLYYRVNYCGSNFVLKANERTKINGILLQQDETAMKDENVAEICHKMTKHLKTWTARQLSILGKILIVKTYGISQVIYLMQSMCLSDAHVKQINAILYKFIWNKHFMAAKAPERIKREIVNKPIKLGGLGMLNIVELDASLKVKALGRLLETNHPFLTLIKSRVDLSDFVHPRIKTRIEEVSAMAVDWLLKERAKTITNPSLESNLAFVRAIKNVHIQSALSRTGKLSLSWHQIRQRGKSKMGELSSQELATLRRFLNPDLAARAAAIDTINVVPENTLSDCLLVNDKFQSIKTLTSKQIRSTLTDNLPILIFKTGPILTPGQSLNWCFALNKLTCTRHKDIILRLAHGELYSKDRLARRGLIADSSCPRCYQTETLQHKYFDCPYIKEIWSKTLTLTNKLRTNIDPNETLIEKALCCTSNPNSISLTVHAEIVTRIRQLREEEANLLLLPKLFVKNAIVHVWRKELNGATKAQLSAILND